MTPSAEFDIGLWWQDDLPAVLASDFQDALKLADISVKSDSRPRQTYAAMWWMMPTILLVLFSKKYVETLATEAAKRHYPILQKAFARLIRQLFGLEPQKRKRCVSMLFSVVALTKDGVRLKFMFHEGLSFEQYNTSIEAMLDMFSIETQESLGRVAQLVRSPGHRELFLLFDEADNKWKVADPLTEIITPVS